MKVTKLVSKPHFDCFHGRGLFLKIKSPIWDMYHAICHESRAIPDGYTVLSIPTSVMQVHMWGRGGSDFDAWQNRDINFKAEQGVIL